MPTLFCSAGEASGDGACARLIHQIHDLHPQMRFTGIGGSRLRQENVDIWYDTSRWGTIGFVEAVQRLPLIWMISLLVRARLYETRPDALLLVDYGAFNTRLAQWYKRWIGGNVYYYYPPSSWRKHPTSKCDLAHYTDLVITPFPWSDAYLKSNAVESHFLGHPMLDTLNDIAPRQQFRESMGIDSSKVLIGLLPGSRHQEIRHNLPAMLQAFKYLQQHHPEAVAVTAIGNDKEFRWVQKLCSNAGIPVVASNKAHSLMSASDLLWSCSGTATLEAAVIGTPMIIMYRGSKLLEFEYNLLKSKITMFGMPNLICERKVIPELVQNEANPTRLLAESENIWPETEGAEAQKQTFNEIRAALGQRGATLRAAEMIIQHMQKATMRSISTPK